MSVLSAHDRGLHYGDGLFETISCVNGRPRWWSRHLSRLQRGCERLRISMPEPTTMRARVAALAADHERCIVKLIVTRGIVAARGYRPSGSEQPTLLAMFYPWPAATADAFDVTISPVLLGENPLLAGLKHLNRLEQVLAQQSLADSAASEALMLSSSGNVICGSMSNLFLCEEAALVTPRLDTCGVAGIMRGLVIDAASDLGVPVHIETVSLERLQAATALFVSNVRLGLQAVSHIGGRTLRVDSRMIPLRDRIYAHSD